MQDRHWKLRIMVKRTITQYNKILSHLKMKMKTAVKMAQHQ